VRASIDPRLREGPYRGRLRTIAAAGGRRHHRRQPWRFVVVESQGVATLADAMAETWRAVRLDGQDETIVAARLQKSDRLSAPV
jgi:nitroreductase